MSDPIQIDGSYGEGGGQILRTSLSLAAITGRAIEVYNIRANRSKPGLQAQHLASVRAAGAICGAEMRGDAVGSVHLIFRPMHESRTGEYGFDIGTAGATTLVAQTVLLPLCLAGGNSKVSIKGGTHNPMAPTADYLEHVYLETLRKHGYNANSEFGPSGFYPRGGGHLSVDIADTGSLEAFRLTKRNEATPRSYVVTNSLPETVGERAKDVLTKRDLTDVQLRNDNGVSTGAAVTIVRGTAGFSSLGEGGKPMERVTNEAVDAFKEWESSDAAMDEHLADQLVLPALFALEPSEWKTNRITEHLRSVLWLARQFADFEYSVDESSGLVRVSPAPDLRKR